MTQLRINGKKACIKCGVWKKENVLNFSKRKSYKYGLINICRDCSNKRQNEYNRKNENLKEYRREYAKRYNKENKEKIAAKAKTKRAFMNEKGKEELKKKRNKWRKENDYDRKYYALNKKKIKKYYRKYLAKLGIEEVRRRQRIYNKTHSEKVKNKN